MRCEYLLNQTFNRDLSVPIVFFLIIILYLFKFSIDPFLPVNIAFLYGDINQSDIPGFVTFGKTIMIITGLNSLSLLNFPLNLLPLTFLLLAIVRELDSHRFLIFSGVLLLGIFSEGLYIFVHHVSYILFLSILLLLLQFARMNSIKFLWVIIILFFSLNLIGYKLVYYSFLILCFFVIFRSITFNQKSKVPGVSFVITLVVIIFVTNKYLFNKAIPEFLTSAQPILGLERYIENLFYKINYCFEDTCFLPYYYQSPIYSKIGYIVIILLILTSAVYYVIKIIQTKKVTEIDLILISTLISSIFLVLTYSTLGLFHVNYLFFALSLLFIFQVFQKKNRFILFLIALAISLHYSGTILCFEGRFNPADDYVTTLYLGSAWLSKTSTSQDLVYADVFSRGIYTNVWEESGHVSAKPIWLTMKDLALFIKGKKIDFLIYSKSLPWWEMESWAKILPPEYYFGHLISVNHLIYSSDGNLLIFRG